MGRLKDFTIGLFVILWAWIFVGAKAPVFQYLNLGVLTLGVSAILYSKSKQGSGWHWPAGLVVFGAFGLVRWLWVGKAPIAEFGSLDKVNSTFFFLLVAILTVQYLHGWQKARSWENALIGLSILFALYEMLLAFIWFRDWWLASGNWFSWPPIGYRLEGKLLGHPNVTSGFLNLSLPLVFARLLVNKKRSRKVVWVGTLILFATIQFFTSSRTGWVAGAASLMVTFVLLKMPDLLESNIWQWLKDMATRRNIIIAASGLVVITLGFGLLFSQAGITPGHGGRLDIWANAIEVWSADWLLGRGTWAFPVYYAQTMQAPPGFIAWQAHNIVLEFGAEYGLVGLLLLVAAFMAGISLWWKAWKSSDRRTREALAAYAGVGVAVWLHHLGDHFIDSHVYIAGLIVIFANVHARTGQKKKVYSTSTASFLLVVVIFGVVSLGIINAAKGLDEYHQGVEAGTDDEWEQAAMDICHQADSRQEVPFFQFECALAISFEGFSSRQGAGWEDEAIWYMEKGLDLDPYWPLHWAFMGELQWRNGDREAALESMRRANKAAPRNARLALRLGWMLEAAGAFEEARDAYRQALYLQPWYTVIQNTSGSTVFEEMRTQPEVSEGSASGQQLVVDAYNSLMAGNLDEAEVKLRAEIKRSYLNAEAHGLLGLVMVTADQPDEGWLETQTSLLIRQTPNVLGWAAKAAILRGDDEIAAEYLWQAYEQLSRISYDSTRFYEGVYHRRFLPYDRVPWLSRGDLLPEMVEGLRWLAEYYQEKGNDEYAEEILGWLEVRGWEMGGGDQ